MTASNGFVYEKGGLYLRYSDQTTHTGRHIRCEWVTELGRATVFCVPLSSRLRPEIRDAVRVAVIETRTVVRSA